MGTEIYIKTLRTRRYCLLSKRFQSSYCAKVRAGAKKGVFFFFLLLSQLSRRTSRGNACYAGYRRYRCPIQFIPVFFFFFFFCTVFICYFFTL